MRSQPVGYAERPAGGPSWNAFILGRSKTLAQDVTANSADTQALSLRSAIQWTGLSAPNQDDTAAAHMTENGYVRHRMLELEVRLAA